MAAPPAAGAAAAAASAPAEEEIGDVWTLRLMGQTSACHLAKFAETVLRRGNEQITIGAPPLSDTSYCKPPVYMYSEQEPETFSEDEEGEKVLQKRAAGEDKFDKHAARRRRRRRAGPVQWKIEDSRDFFLEKGLLYVGDKEGAQQSKYVLLEAEPETMTVRVTPVDEWWDFKRPARIVGPKMTVQQAEEEMSAISRGKTTVNATLAKRLRDREAAESQALDAIVDKSESAPGAFFERRSVLGGRGGGRGRGRGREKGGGGKGPTDERPDDKQEEEAKVVGLGAAGEDLEEARQETARDPGEHGNDYEEEYSDDEGNEGVDEVGGANIERSKRAPLEDDENADGTGGELDENGKELAQINRKFLEQEESDTDDSEDEGEQRAGSANDVEEVYTLASGLKRSAASASHANGAVAKRARIGEAASSAQAPTNANSPGSTATAAAGGAGLQAAPAAPPQVASLDLTEEKVARALKARGGSMKTNELINAFKAELRHDSSNKQKFKAILFRIATQFDDAVLGKGFQLRARFMEDA